jgi:hypothetical protein
MTTLKANGPELAILTERGREHGGLLGGHSALPRWEHGSRSRRARGLEAIRAARMRVPACGGCAGSRPRAHSGTRGEHGFLALALQLRFLKVSESMGNHDSKIVDAGGVD